MSIIDNLPIFVSLKTGLIKTVNSPDISLLMLMNIQYLIHKPLLSSLDISFLFNEILLRNFSTYIIALQD